MDRGQGAGPGYRDDLPVDKGRGRGRTAAPGSGRSQEEWRDASVTAWNPDRLQATQAWTGSPSASKIPFMKAGRSSGVRLVTMLPSRTHAASCQIPPAFSTS